LIAIDALDGAGAVRFSELRRRMGTISQKMLTKTLRRLERDGLVTRAVYPEVPPRVEYRLTPLGRALGKAVCGVWTWAARHGATVERARQTYDAARPKRSVAAAARGSPTSASSRAAVA
jgi:DNA-binding HxlR family transcriptional regulator